MWEIFNVPSVQAVCYNSILNRKRELLNLVQGCETKVSECYQNHCCKVICCSSHTVQRQIFVSFLTDCHPTSNLGLNLSIDRSNLLELFNYYLMFIKKLDSEIVCLLSNEKLYVKCKSSFCWSLFYGLYHLLLNKSVKIIIGMQFYYSFACYRLITNELLLLTKITYFCHDSRCKFVRNIGLNLTCKGCISSSPLEIESVMEVSLSKAVKRKNVDLLFQNQNEILLKKPKYFFSSMSSQVKLNPSCQASPCKNIKWKEFSALKSQVIKYSSLLRKKSNLNKFKISDAYQTEFFNTFNNPEKIYTSENFTSSHPLTEVCRSESFNKGNNNFISDSSFHPKYENNAIRNPNSTTENSSLDPSKISIESSELGTKADDFELQSSCSMLKLQSNKNYTNSYMGFKTANGKNIIFSQTALKSAQKILHTVSVEQKDLTNFNSAKNSKSDTSDNITRNSCKESSENGEKNSYFQHNAVVNNFKLKSSNSSNLQSNENDNLSLIGFKTANGRNISFSQSALKSAQKVLQEVSVEENDLSNSVSEKNDKSGARNCTNQNSCMRSSKSSMKSFFSLPHDAKVDDFKLKSICLGPNLQSNKSDDASLTGFQTANGKNISFSQSALKSAQKILQEASVDESKTFDFSPEKKCEDSLHNHRNLKENLNDAYDDANDLKMDLDMAEKFFTDMSFDEDIEIISEHIKPPALFQSNCTVLHNAPSKKRKKSLGTRRVFEVVPKKHKIFNS